MPYLDPLPPAEHPPFMPLLFPEADETSEAARLHGVGGKIVYCERKGNIRVDVRARGRAKRSAPRKAAACAPGGTEGQ